MQGIRIIVTVALVCAASLVAAAPAAAQGASFETSALVGEVDGARTTILASGPERVSPRPRQQAAGIAPKAPVAAAATAVLLLAFGLLVAPRRRGTS